MLDRFPKKRPPLPPQIAQLYSALYKANREGETIASSLSQRMERWLHRQVAKDLVGDHNVKTTLEIGAGTLNHLQYEPGVGPYDIVEPFEEAYKNSKMLSRIRKIYTDIKDIPLEQDYDRITSIASLEHICDLPHVIARTGVLLAPGGQLRVSIPAEGTPLWTLGWKLTTGLEFRIRYNLDYGQVMKHEHVNTASEIEDLLRYFFRSIDCKVFGFSKYLSLYQFYACRDPDLKKCESLIG
jgi:SAM-dependent methyltransferase